MKYFSSDWHFNHKNIVRGVSDWTDKSGCRDFTSVEEMNSIIFDSINSTVGQDDELYFLGDFNFGDKSKTPELRRRIVCQNIHIIYGNHDHHIISNPEFQSLFSSCQYYLETKIHSKKGGGVGLVLFNYCINGVWNKASKGYGHLFGHSHSSLDKKFIRGKAFDVGWDCWGKPLSEHEVCDVLNSLKTEEIDHHNSETACP